MKKPIGLLLLIAGVIWMLFSFNMSTLEQYEADENLRNALSDAFSGGHHERISNPELINRRTNHLIASCVMIVAGIVVLVTSGQKKIVGENTTYSVSDEIKKLHDLKKQGLITETEYNDQKSKILS